MTRKEQEIKGGVPKREAKYLGARTPNLRNWVLMVPVSRRPAWCWAQVDSP